MSTEEIVGMILKHVKKLSEKQANLEIRDCVITVPSDWSLRQRNSLNTAAMIAGLNPLSI